MSFEDLAKKLAELMRDTEKLELTDVDLIAEKLEMEFLPGIMTSAVGAALPGIGKAKGPIEWTEAILQLGDISYDGKIETIEFVRSNGAKGSRAQPGS